VADQAAKARAEAIKGFAEVLRNLRKSVGNPAFREMSGRSRAISHTTLHEAAQGNRLPSWATTVEFVKACGADPAVYREDWEQADRVVRSANSVRVTTPASDSVSRLSAGIAIPAAGVTDRRTIHAAIGPEPPTSDPSDDTLGPAEPPAPGNRRRRRFVLAGAVAVGVIALSVTITVIAIRSGPDSPEAKSSDPTTPPHAKLTPANCPMHSANPPVKPPLHTGDASSFIADITLPDCSHIRRGHTATKVWRIKNVGTVPWKDYSLHRLDLPQQRDQCQTISDVPIKDTVPGDIVDIKTAVTAPMTPSFCFVRFKMLDADGQVAFPGNRPVNFQLIVD
jgi:hypothetical protein